MKKKFLLLILLTIPLIIYIPHLNEFAYPFQSPYSDVAVTHFPNAVYVRYSLTEWGQIPLWSETILSGYPFIANPLSGLFYFPGWLQFLLDLPLAFNLTILIHVVLAGIGMYLFLRETGFDTLPAITGGLIFELMPKLFGHFAAGHVTLVYAVSWTPWLMFAQKRNPYNFSISAVTSFVLIILADVRWAAYTTVLWGCYSFYLTAGSKRIKHWRLCFRELIREGGRFLAQVIVGIMLAAPLVLLLFQYSSLSTRSEMIGSDVLINSLPPLNMIGLIFPNFGSYAEWLVYPGAVSILMFVWVLVVPSLRGQYRFWIAVLAFSLLASLGSYNPLLSWVFTLPGVNQLRVPSRLLFISGFAFSFLSAGGIQWWVKDRDSLPSFMKKKFTWLVILVFIVWVITFGMWFLLKQFPVEFIWGSVVITSVVFLLIMRMRNIIGRDVLAVGIILITIIDLVGVGLTQFNFRTKVDVLSEGIDLSAAPVDLQENRVYSEDYNSLPQQMSAEHNLRLIGGADPLQLRAYVNYFSMASGIPVTHYSILLPPSASDLGVIDYGQFTPNPVLLGKLNVRYLITDHDVEIRDLILINTTNSYRIYENLDLRPAAWVQPELDSPTDYKQVLSTSRTPNQVLVRAEGPGYLVLSEINYPGWKVSVDNKIDDVLSVDGLFRSVKLDAGVHNVKFSFEPPLLFMGIIIQVMTVIGLVVFWIIHGQMPKENSSDPIFLYPETEKCDNE